MADDVEPVAPLALFDLDNTLIDRSAAFAAWADGFARRVGLGEYAPRWLIDADGQGLASREQFFDTVRTRLSLSDSVEALIDQYHREYPPYFRPDSDVIDALVRLRQSGWKIAAVTNGSSHQRAKVEHSGISELLDACCISAEIGSAKPDRRIFEEAARRCGVPLSGWMVGDTDATDVAGGRDAGLKTIWMARGRTWRSAAFQPDHIVTSIAEAVDIMLAPSTESPFFSPANAPSAYPATGGGARDRAD
jgi:HAD superfamily hydrolase (TIGR01549 family)